MVSRHSEENCKTDFSYLSRTSEAGTQFLMKALHYGKLEM